MFPFTMRRWLEPREHYIWAQVRILHETNKTILVTAPFIIAGSMARSDRRCNVRRSAVCSANGQSQIEDIKIWIPKSQIFGIRIRKNIFEIYVREGIVR